MIVLCAKFRVSSFVRYGDMDVVPNLKKVGHATQATPLLTYFCIFWFIGLELNPHTKFEVCNYSQAVLIISTAHDVMKLTFAGFDFHLFTVIGM